MTRKYTIAALVLPFLLVLSSTATAFEYETAMVDADLSWDDTVGVSFFFNNQYVQTSAGEFDVKLDFTYDGVYDWNTAAYCVDLFQPAQLDHPYEAELNELDSLGLRRAAWIMDNYSGSGDAIQDAAVQIAIWESITDSESFFGLNLSLGGFALTNLGNDQQVVAYAQSYLEAVSGADLNDLNHSYMVAHNDRYQDLLVTVPVPAAVWLFGSALVGFIGFGRRSKN